MLLRKSGDLVLLGVDRFVLLMLFWLDLNSILAASFFGRLRRRDVNHLLGFLEKRPGVERPVICKQVADARMRIPKTEDMGMKKSEEKKKNFNLLPIFDKLEFVKANHVRMLFLFGKNDLVMSFANKFQKYS